MSESPSILRVLHEVVEIDEQLKALKYSDIDFDKKIRQCRSRLSVANAKIRCLNILKTCANILTDEPATHPKSIMRQQVKTKTKTKTKKNHIKAWNYILT